MYIPDSTTFDLYLLRGHHETCLYKFDPLKSHFYIVKRKGEIKVQGVPQSQTAALPRHQEEEETDKSKQAQTEQTYEKH